MKKETIDKINKKYNINYGHTQVLVLKNIFKKYKNAQSFRQFLLGMIDRLSVNNCVISDFYELKQIQLNSLTFCKPSVMNEERFIIYYGKVKGKKLYKEKCYKQGVSFRDPEIQRQNSLKFQAKRKQNPEKYNNLYENQIGYWIKRGYSEEEQKNKVSERQRTFTLEKCIEKHGKEMGTNIWRQRQDKWQNTLNSKSPEEIKRINMLKSNGTGNILDKNTQCKLYYIKFYNDEIEFWKVGITTQDVFGGRFDKHDVLATKYNLNADLIRVIEFDNVYEAYDAEQQVLLQNTENRIIVNYNGFNSTECFSKNVLG